MEKLINEIEKIVKDAPEININNYNDVDIMNLNDVVYEIYDKIRKYKYNIKKSKFIINHVVKI